MATRHPVPAPVDGMILLDIGAATTCISLDVANELELVQTRTCTSHGAGGLHRNPVFRARLNISVGKSHGRTPLVWEQEAAAIPDIDKYVKEVDLKVDGSPVRHLGLLGRDILRNAVVYYNGITGKFQVNFDLGQITRPE
jgi:hypothetical protein